MGRVGSKLHPRRHYCPLAISARQGNYGNRRASRFGVDWAGSGDVGGSLATISRAGKVVGRWPGRVGSET